jgi:hypothetical protein
MTTSSRSRRQTLQASLAVAGTGLSLFSMAIGGRVMANYVTPSVFSMKPLCCDAGNNQ